MATAVTTPSETVAIDELPVDHVIVLPEASTGSIVGVRVAVPPMGKYIVAWSSEMLSAVAENIGFLL